MKLPNVSLRFLPPYTLSTTWETTNFSQGGREEELRLCSLMGHSLLQLACPNPPSLPKTIRRWQNQSAEHPVKANLSVQILTGQTSTERVQVEKATPECWPAQCTCLHLRKYDRRPEKNLRMGKKKICRQQNIKWVTAQWDTTCSVFLGYWLQEHPSVSPNTCWMLKYFNIPDLLDHCLEIFPRKLIW